MMFTELDLKGAYLIEPDLRRDRRGFFARSWCQMEFKDHGLSERIAQCNMSFNTKRGTLRGLHYQVQPFAEERIVRCSMGRIYDVILDLRPESTTYGKWLAFELSADNRKMIYVPKGFAHGFQTLSNNAEVFYQMSEPYNADCARGVRWNDARFGIAWPIPNPIISERDSTFLDFV